MAVHMFTGHFTLELLCQCALLPAFITQGNLRNGCILGASKHHVGICTLKEIGTHLPI